MTQHPKQHRKLWLEKLVKDLEFTRGAEIGVHEGVTHFHLLDTCSNLHMIGVDVYMGNQEKYWNDVKEKLKEYDNSTFYRAKSTNAAKQVEDESLDFVFIDARHDYQYVKEDIEAWSLKVKPGGYITGHDIEHSGVKRAVKEIFGEYNTDIDEIWWVQK